ncbi:MAG: hypothetical protein IK010_03905, partial [Bacteroidales bacterium]|nr:hypothetical protein [Bacteroidales bacterium]
GKAVGCFEISNYALRKRGWERKRPRQAHSRLSQVWAGLFIEVYSIAEMVLTVWCFRGRDVSLRQGAM